jgi:hypothetical protein
MRWAARGAALGGGWAPWLAAWLSGPPRGTGAPGPLLRKGRVPTTTVGWRLRLTSAQPPPRAATRALLGASLGVRQPGTWPEARGCCAECGGAPSRNVSISGRPQPEPEHGTLSPPASPPPDARQHCARWRAPKSSVILPPRVRPMLAPRRDRTPGVDRAGLLRGHAVSQRDAALLHPADVHADGAAALRWQPRRVDHGHDVLPGRPAGGLRLRPLHLAPAVAAGPGGRPPRAPARRALHAADRRGCGLAAATRSPHRLLARDPRHRCCSAGSP